ncbi:MAG: FAD-dependent oxidoreductase [Labilithrix sp.]|nr:FAD-dependent oxidoreductase [Labilithrix sp.]
MARRILIVGGGYAGLVCANRLARKTREADAEIVLVEARPWFVERVRLHQDAAGQSVATRTSIASRIRDTRVKLRVGRVEALDLVHRRALVDGVGEAFDDLVLATGSGASRPAVPGLASTLSCDTAEHAALLRARLDALSGGAIVIVGGGLTGIELAAEIAERRRDLTVTLVDAGELGADLSPSARAHLRRVLTSLRVSIRERDRVAAFEVDAVVLASGDALPSDASVWTGGFEAAPLGRLAGLTVDAIGRAHVDERLRSASHGFVRVIGDAARVMTRDSRGALAPVRMACATATPQGAFAADDIAREIEGRTRETFSFGYPGRSISLGRRDGIVQLTDRHDAPGAFIGGRPAAWLKELVCRFAAGANAMERRGVGYAWLRAPAARADTQKVLGT